MGASHRQFGCSAASPGPVRHLHRRVLIGATPEGKKELIGFQIGYRESMQS
ncbi:MAG: transposase-like protein [Hyphomicrobiaceae bacterium]|jgi:transposase-like protein